MKSLRRHPHLLELNALIFLRRMQKKYKSSFGLAEIPQKEWESIASQGFDLVWLMGLWKRSPGARQCALSDPKLRHEYDKALADWKESDVPGSPYAVYDYSLDDSLGAEESLAVLKKNLHEAGLRLIVDYVPNHLALDHGMTLTHPGCFVQASKEEARANPGLFFETPAGKWLAFGKDPYFAPWEDTVQINFMSKAAREFGAATLLKIADIADGVRCDMAMLGIHRVFEQNWGRFVKDARPKEEYWKELISKVRTKNPEFIFMAETYWDLEWELQQMGFDYTYDKKLYDRLLHAPAGEVRGHLNADPEFQNHSVRFLENHDEPRAAEAFGMERSKAAAVVIATIPGLRFFHDGQSQGKKIRLPVQLGREPKEDENASLETFYHKLWQYAGSPVLHEGQWLQLEPREAWAGNASRENILAWVWTLKNEVRLIAVNNSHSQSQARLLFFPDKMNAESLIIKDVLSDIAYERKSKEIKESGLFVDLKPWQCHLLAFKI